MGCSLRNQRKRFTWDMLHYLLGLFIGLILVQAARAEDQQPLMNDGNAVSGPVISIDLGTSYSRVSFVNDGRFEIVTNDHGKSLPTSALD
jgi:heat shock protein 5